METSSGETTPTSHRRNPSGRPTRPRRSTRGPLDLSDSPVTSPSGTPRHPSSPQPPSGPPTPAPLSTYTTASSALPTSLSTYTSAPLYQPKSFPKLLRPELYHPLTHLTVPPPFRQSPSLPVPAPSTPLPELLQRGHFRLAAISAASQLTTSVSPTDHTTIFELLYIRLSCLCLIGSTPLAAQEATALEDLNSSVYRDEATGEHLVPWELRVLAVRLQSVGFSDGRKGVMGYYDLAREARAELARRRMRMQLRARSDTGEAATKEQEKEEETESGEADENEERRRRRREIQMWTDRLSDLGIRVASALVEMGDLDGAAHHLELLALASASASASQQQAILEELPPGNQKHSSRLGLQRAILWLKIGDAAAARRCVERDEKGADIIDALASMADGQYGDAVAKWEVLGRRYAAEEEEGEEAGLYKQNLAVCLLYAGRMEDARAVLEDLISQGHAFHALTFNLCTIYELCTDKSRSLKLQLAESVASFPDEDGLGWEKSVVDFKL